MINFKSFGKFCNEIYKSNDGKSAAIFCSQVAAWVPDMFRNFYLLKNTKLLIIQQPPKLENK